MVARRNTMNRRQNRANHFDFHNVPATLAHLHVRPAFLLRRSQQILTYLYVEECDRSGTEISQTQLEALCVVRACPGLDQTTLARRLGIDRASATAVIDSLARRRLLKRIVQADRRRRALELMPRALQQLKASMRPALRSGERLLKPLGSRDSRRLTEVLVETASQRQSPAPEWEPLSAPPRSSLNQHGYKTLVALYRMPAFLMDRCSQIGTAYLSQAVKPFGLSSGQYGVLFVVAALGPLDQSGLRRALGIDRSSASVIVPTLEARGFITREMDLLDRRRSILRCTPAGLKLLQKMHSFTEAAQNRVFDGLSADVQGRLCALLSRLVGAHDGFHAEYSKGTSS
jgi:DNA-binding MarR family transcriptional regulator